MSNIRKMAVNTEPYEQLDKVAMTPTEREEAIYALRVGEEIADVILWISNAIKRRFVGGAAKKGFKGEVAI